jgi:hypothetical protein
MTYLDWLLKKSCLEGYEKLYSFLDSLEFEVVLPRDNNRCEDGKVLRSNYFLEENKNVSMLKPASVLEVLIAIGYKVIDMIAEEKTIQEMVFEFISNLGLGLYTNDRFDVREITDIINIFMKRQYKYNGDGSIFPVGITMQDQREIELWYQMCKYINTYYSV